MITIKQYGFECEYELNVFARLYFGNNAEVGIETHFRRLDGEELLKINRESVKLLGKEFMQKNFSWCESVITFGGDEYRATAEMEIKPYYDGDIVKKVYKNSVIESFCRAAEFIKHVDRPWGVMSGIRPAKNIRRLLEKFGKDKAVDIMNDIYGVRKEKIALAMEVYENEREIIETHDEMSAGIYIGIPFCPTRCSYCSFVSLPMSMSGKYIPEYIPCLEKEIEKTGAGLERVGMYPETIYIGGGTPTSLSEEYLERIFSAAEKYFDMSGVKEITLEAGRPDTITEAKLECARRHGVNRISINPQSMHQITLDRIGRKHTPEDIVKSFELARKCGFENINMDLIAGLPGENTDMFRESIDRVCSIGSDNITVHTMCIKRAADISEISSEYVNEMLEYAGEKLRSSGYIPYYMYRQKNIAGNLENVGYTLPGKEGIYNIKIMEEIQNIIALGGGGSSKIILGDCIERIFNFKDAAEYIRRFDEISERKDISFDMIYNYRTTGKKYIASGSGKV